MLQAENGIVRSSASGCMFAATSGSMIVKVWLAPRFGPRLVLAAVGGMWHWTHERSCTLGLCLTPIAP